MFKRDRVNLRKKSSIFFMGILLFVTLGFSFFLSSKFIFTEKIPIRNTTINEELSIPGSGSVIIQSWLYDPSKNEMEVTLLTKDIKNLENDVLFNVFQRNGNLNGLQVKTVFNDDEIYVLKIYGLSNEFQQVALDVIKQTDEEFNEMEQTSHQKSEKHKQVLTTLYADQRKVKQEKIDVKTDKEYEVYLSDVLIEETNLQIKKAKNDIQNEETKQQTIQNEIKNNEEKLIYQTEDEKAETQSIIDGYQQLINESSEKKEQFEEKITLLNEKIEKLELKKRESNLSGKL